MKYFDSLSILFCLGFSAYLGYLAFTSDDGAAGLFSRILSILILLFLAFFILKDANTTKQQRIERKVRKYKGRGFWYFVFWNGIVLMMTVGFIGWTIDIADLADHHGILASFIRHMSFYVMSGLFVGWFLWKQHKKDEQSL